MAFTSERVPPVDADTAVNALRPRCRGAFLAHFLFPRFALECSFCSRFPFFSVVCSHLTFSVTYNAIYEFLHKLKQRLYSDHFTISHAVQIHVVHPWLSTPGMNFRYTICNWERIRFDLGVSVWR